MNKKPLFIALFSVFAASAALAQGSADSHMDEPTGSAVHHEHGKHKGATQMDPTKRSEQIFKQADVNKDGKITLAEAKANAPRLAVMFDAIDLKHEGFITPESLKAFYGRMFAAGQQERAKRLDTMFKQLDKNGDGFLTKDEVKGHKRLARAFDKIDTNKDGKLSEEELKGFMGKMRDGHHARGERHED